MEEGYFFDEFIHLEDEELNIEEKMPFVQKLLHKLNWRELSEEEEFRFMTGFYAQIGKENDAIAYYAICNWMEDVGWRLNNSYGTHYFADKIGAERIYRSYFSPCKYTGYDFIACVVEDPQRENWDQMGEFRPTIVFSEWLNANPDYRTKHQPINLDLLHQFQ